MASRLIEKYYRPTVVFTKSGDKLAASVRSVKGFDVYNALEQCMEFIEQFGGHKYAAGLTLKIENYGAFKKRFEEVVCATIQQQDTKEEVLIDLQIPLTAINPKFYRIIKQMEPFGPGNMNPIFMSTRVVDTGYAKTVGVDDKHIKACMTSGKPQASRISAIGFNLGEKLTLLQGSDKVAIAYSIDENTWNLRT